jgi:hypothetical protein
MTTPRTPNVILRVWRETQGMTRPMMATALNRTPSAQRDNLTCDAKHIARWESGDIRWPSPRYQRALHDLTGRYPADLGFTTDPEPSPQPTPALPARAPSSPPVQDDLRAIGDDLNAVADDLDAAEDDLDAIGDLTDLAAELSTRGYRTSVGAGPTRLTIGNPAAGNRRDIITIGPCFCLDEIPFSLRPPMPLAITADAVDAVMSLTTAR